MHGSLRFMVNNHPTLMAELKGQGSLVLQLELGLGLGLGARAREWGFCSIFFFFVC